MIFLGVQHPKTLSVTCGGDGGVKVFSLENLASHVHLSLWYHYNYTAS